MYILSTLFCAIYTTLQAAEHNWLMFVLWLFLTAMELPSAFNPSRLARKKSEAFCAVFAVLTLFAAAAAIRAGIHGNYMVAVDWTVLGIIDGLWCAQSFGVKSDE